PEILKFNPKGASDIPRDIFPAALRAHQMYGYQSKCYFKEVGQLFRYELAKQDIESGRVKLDL
ncbi:MAG: hypothetical protein Q7R47_03715, partial [Candidatus Diapherotrites archaeon]|nr:hypothetical protein [Candidatus Diapherotrites archaeon]